MQLIQERETALEKYEQCVNLKQQVCTIIIIGSSINHNSAAGGRTVWQICSSFE